MPKRRGRWSLKEKSLRVAGDFLLVAELIVGMYVLGRLVVWLLPEWETSANAVEFYIFIGLEIELAVLLGWDLLRGDSLHAFAAA